ncbi:mitochondrial ribosomal protein subunit L20-domain-containing protein [Panaeolus papilionaceus]|nr:mitochondrial ribosomal protein subunit L20-domain-containing protein [Panaeolus papilionaceus]
MLKPTRSISFSWSIARNAPKYPRPRPGTSERPAYHAPDPLVNNPKAAVTELEEGSLTFIHRPPPTAPSPFSTTLDPISPLLRPSASARTGPLPPPSRSTKAHPLVQLTEEQRKQMRELRVSNPAKYTRGVLAKMFGCSNELVGHVAALPKPQRKAALKAREEIHEAHREKWSEKHSLVMAIRKKRREMW